MVVMPPTDAMAHDLQRSRPACRVLIARRRLQTMCRMEKGAAYLRVIPKLSFAHVVLFAVFLRFRDRK